MKAAAKAAPRPARARGIERRMAVLIVGGALLRIAQGFVGLAEFLEFFLGGLVARIFVRVKFHGQLAVSLLDFLVAGVAVNAQHFIIIALGHGSAAGGMAVGAAGFLATTTVAGRNRRSRSL